MNIPVVNVNTPFPLEPTPAQMAVLTPSAQVETTTQRWARDMEHGVARVAITPGPNKPSVT